MHPSGSWEFNGGIPGLLLTAWWEQNATRRGPMSTLSPTAHPLIAVIDDDPHIVAWLSDLLSDAGYRVITACRRDAAYDRLRQQRPAVILVDLNLDYVAEGWVLLDLLQATPALAEIPVIVWSADIQALAANARRAAAKGWRCLAKPCAGADVLAVIQQCLDGRASIDRPPVHAVAPQVAPGTTPSDR
jgi:CheY-like chemotaxis protein